MGTVQRRAVSDSYSFFPDGTLYWGLPERGLARFDMSRDCRGKEQFCGTYDRNGDSISIVLHLGNYRKTGTFVSGSSPPRNTSWNSTISSRRSISTH